MVLEMDSAIHVQNLNEAVCFSHRANSFGKAMNPTIFPPKIKKLIS